MRHAVVEQFGEGLNLTPRGITQKDYFKTKLMSETTVLRQNLEAINVVNYDSLSL